MITDRTGPHKVLLPISQLKLWQNFGKKLDFSYVYISIQKKQQQWQLLTLQNARQMQAHMVCSVHLHRHDMLTDPPTVQL